MKYGLISIFIVGLLVSDSFSQVADVSMFSSTRSINPGLSHLRSSGFLSVDGSKYQIEKHQDVPFPEGIDTTVDLNTMSFYRAGKGNGLTTEFLVSNQNADKVDTFIDATDEVKSTTKASSTHIDLKIDLTYMGFGLARGTYKNDNSFKSSNFDIKNVSDITYYCLSLGRSVSFGALKLGMFYEAVKVSGESKSNFMTEQTVQSFDALDHVGGVGIALSGKNYHFEVSYEQKKTEEPEAVEGQPATKEPVQKRISGIIEFKMGKLALGVRSRLIDGNYFDLSNLIMSQMLYSGFLHESRLENSFNFSYGSDKGIGVSGFISVSNSTADEGSDYFVGTTKYKSEIKSQAIGLTISYVY